MPKKNKTMMTPTNILIITCTYAAALAILTFGDMNPLVVAAMPCLALSFSLLLRK